MKFIFSLPPSPLLPSSPPPPHQVMSHEELRDILSKENAPLMQARASYDFEPQSEKELQFKKVDTPLAMVPASAGHRPIASPGLGSSLS